MPRFFRLEYSEKGNHDARELSFRTATKGDAGLLLRFIKDWQSTKAPGRVGRHGGGSDGLPVVRRIAEAQFVLANGVEVGYAFYYYRYSTFW
jgi:hypothetical protein